MKTILREDTHTHAAVQDIRMPTKTMHCIYCGATLPVTHILYDREPPEMQAARLAFEDLHDATCGPKSVGMILD